MAIRYSCLLLWIMCPLIVHLAVMNQTRLTADVKEALQDDGFIPRVPYVKALPDGLKDQTFITIHGQPESNADRFSINFYKGDDVAFHFNPRFNENGKEVIVRNSKSGGVWQKEEKELSFFPFKPGKPFEIKIICTSSGFTVEVDNYRLLNFSHRMRDIENLTTLVIDGNIILKHVAIDGFIPRVPYVKALPEGLKDQTFITIHGQPESNADRFSINFYKGDDVAFHFNPRFNENGKEVIVRNSKSGGVWQKEEKELSFFPFKPGKPFEIKIICTSSGFTVEVDDYRLLNFSHRMKDIENLTMLVIDGNIILKHVAIGGFLLKVPYVKVLPEGLKSQTVITIHGQPTTNADRFSINFYKGNNVAFHFNPRFNEEVIVRNSRTGGVWQNEERELSFFPFKPGKPFEIKIICTYSEFRVEVDNNHLLNFSHRMKDLRSLTTFVIGGNIVLKHVTGI